ncbi:uncharacterized protein [Blastocystis hominis]|uniref:Uncharacterized protein n=1 Tax=Blastocystis hominis TaxID=12968 RepID=D8M1T8_BLAHO|nr:uncharacterized protein [Blastocystis hominis]CBK22027.2 unnamed protein product [Blastocystis hominis]|eukprot:XP_012896075.1 uncharacterized protein [Blastocystis hominis]
MLSVIRKAFLPIATRAFSTLAENIIVGNKTYRFSKPPPREID